MSYFLANISTFPTNIMTVMFVVLFCLLLVSFISGLDQDLGIDIDIDDNVNMSILGKIFIATGLSKTPLVIGLAITAFIGLGISYFLQFVLLSFIFSFTGIIKYIIGIPFFLIVFTISLYIAGFICRPLEALFDINSTRALMNYVGQKGTVKTLSVVKDYGEIEIVTDQHRYRIDVYSDESEDIKQDDTVIVVSYDNDKKRYFVKKI